MVSETVDDETLHKLVEDEYPEVAPHTCGFCQKIIMGVGDGQEELRIFEHDQQQGRPITVAESCQAALDGCQFCRYLFAVDSTFGKMPLEEAAGVVATGQYGQLLSTSHFLEAANGPFLYASRGRYNPEYGRRRGRIGNTTMCKFQLYKALAYSESGSDSITEEQLLNAFLPPNLVPGSRLSEQRAARWLDECERGHDRCRAYQQAFAPKRLLEISIDRRMVRVQDCHRDSTRYATLSYCWGGDQPLKATKDSIETLSQWFDVEEMPASVRDGIKVAAGLGFQFLWVDAYCIVQNDEQDVREQIAQMHKIYSGSTITIAASSSPASSKGFLEPRVAWRPMELTFRSDSGVCFPALAVPADIHKRESINKNPLFTRAWAYQENQVTTRVLSFNARAISFSCLEMDHQDGGNYKVDFDAYMGQDAGRAGFLNAGMKSLTFAEHPRAWTDLVTTYAKLGLSEPSDKLPALAALAEEYGKRCSLSTYLAGVWLDALQWQLLWSRDDTGIQVTRPPEYCGPSWSWCSVVGEITFSHDYKKPSELEHLCSVKTASTKLDPGSHAFGRVGQGKLVLSGRVRDLTWFNRVTGAPGHVRNPRSYARAVEAVDASYLIGDFNVDKRLEILEDVQSEWPEGTDVHFSAIEIARFRDNFSENFDKTYTRALLLHKSEGVECEPVYRRAGMLFVDTETGKGEDWFDEASTYMEVTIV